MSLTGSFDIVLGTLEIKGTITDTSAVPVVSQTPVTASPIPATPTLVASTPVVPASTPAVYSGKVLPSGMPLVYFGADHPYRQRIDALPIDTRLIAATWGGPTGGTAIVTDTVDAHVRKWSSAGHGVMLAGPIPRTVVSSKANPEQMIAVRMSLDAYWDESDGIVGPLVDGFRYTLPIPVRDARIENGVLQGQAVVPGQTADGHILAYDTETGLTHELYHVTRAADGTMTCQQYSCFNAIGARVGMPSKYCTSADAAGLSVTQGLVTWEEVAYCLANGLEDLGHALRVTFNHTRNDFHTAGWFIAPATHAAGDLSTIGVVMGQRLRIVAGTVMPASLSAMDKLFWNTFARYGVFVADNGGDWFINTDDDPRWLSDGNGYNFLSAGLMGAQMEVVNNGPWTNSNGDTNGTLS